MSPSHLKHLYYTKIGINLEKIDKKLCDDDLLDRIKDKLTSKVEGDQYTSKTIENQSTTVEESKMPKCFENVGFHTKILYFFPN